MDAIQNVNADAPFAQAPAPALPPSSAMEQVKSDIAKIEDAIKNLESIGDDICATELVILRQKRDTLIGKIKAEAENIAQEAGQIEQSFTQKYGAGTVHAVEIGLLLTILGRLFGVV